MLINKLYGIQNTQTKNCFVYKAQSIFWGLAGSHPHTDSGKNMGFLAPAYARPPFTAVVCCGVDNGDASAVATTFEPYPS